MLNKDLELQSEKSIYKKQKTVLTRVESTESFSKENRIKLAGLKRQLEKTVSRVAELKTISFTNKNMTPKEMQSALASGDYTNHKVTRNTIDHFNQKVNIVLAEEGLNIASRGTIGTFARIRESELKDTDKLFKRL